MAKKSMIARDIKRSRLINKYEVKRKQLKNIVKSLDTSISEKMEAQKKLQMLPRDSSYSRIRNRCKITGRPHGFYRKFALGRNKLRQLAMQGDIPGIKKASW